MILFPLALGLAVLPLPFLGPLYRLLIILSVLPAALHLGRKMGRIEQAWLLSLALYFVAVLIVALYAADRAMASIDIARQLFLLSVAALLTGELRAAHARKWLAIGFCGLAFAMSIYLVIQFISAFGVSPETFAQAASLKGLSASNLSGSLNPLSFAILLAILISFPVWRRNLLISAPLLVLSCAAIWIAGSRTTMLALGLGYALHLIAAVAPQSRRPSRFAVYAVAGGTFFAASFMAYVNKLRIVDPAALDAITANRWTLWRAALAKFQDRPWTGWGANSWRTNLENYISTDDPVRAQAILELQSGGFHSAYLGLLAERGIVGATAAAFLLAVLAYAVFRAFNARVYLPDQFSRYIASVAPLGFFLVVVRGLAEQPGLFGYADGVVDFATYAWAAIVIAVAAEATKHSHRGGASYTSISHSLYSRESVGRSTVRLPPR